ncbi:MAG: hypothetical protein WBB72_00560 [Methyloceanibacter sp.]
MRLLTVGRTKWLTRNGDCTQFSKEKTMPVNGIKAREWQQSGSQIVTSDFNMVPGEMMVTAALTGTTGGGTQFAGIVRASSAQAGEESFGQWWQWRSALGRKGLRTLTVGIATGQDQTAQAVFSIFIF